VPLAASGSSGGSILPLLLFIMIPLGMYFLMIRPQQRRAREMQRMQSDLTPGAEVMTGSGMYGTVTEVDEEDGTVVLEISSEVHVRFARAAIARVLSPGSGTDAGTGTAGAEPAAVEPAPTTATPVSADVDDEVDTDVRANEIINRRKD
jgi:preprotein translocase subunit YajC